MKKQKSHNVCLSGGTEGADTVFGEEAVRVGHEVYHFSFLDHHAAESNKEGIYRLSPLQLKEADPFLLKANKTLKRRFPTSHVYIDNLLRRNYWQIRTTERVYAVASFGADTNKIVVGGTAWAVQMAIDKGVSEIYLFDQIQRNCWFMWYENGFEYIHEAEVPFPHGRYTGIGSRELNETGISAIKSLYGG